MGVALDIRIQKLAVADIVFRVTEPGGPFWDEPLRDEQGRGVVAVTFVDDLCAALIASSPAALDAAVVVLLRCS